MNTNSDRKIKNFNQFSMERPQYYKILNQLVVIGEYRLGFFSRKKKFSVTIYYTPIKQKILSIISNNIEDLPFKRGDNISAVRDWVKANNYEVTIDKKKI